MKKYEYLAGALREKVANSPQGERLPSVRALMKRYGMSMQTVTKTLRMLAEEGRIEMRQGSGIYVQPSPQQKFIEFHHGLYPSRNLEMKKRSLDLAFSAMNWKLITQRHDTNYDAPDSRPSNSVCAHIVMGDLISQGIPFFKMLLEGPQPVVSLGREAESFGIDYVTGNDVQTVSLVVRHLYDFGHRKIAFLMNESDCYEVRQQRQIIASVCEGLGLGAPLFIECNAPLTEKTIFQAWAGLRGYLESHSAPYAFTALVTSSAQGSLGALRALSEFGLNVPSQCSVASLGAEEEHRIYLPSVTDAGMRVEAWGVGVAQILTQRFENPLSPPIGMRLQSQLNIRESTTICAARLAARAGARRKAAG